MPLAAPLVERESVVDPCASLPPSDAQALLTRGLEDPATWSITVLYYDGQY